MNANKNMSKPIENGDQRWRAFLSGLLHRISVAAFVFYVMSVGVFGQTTTSTIEGTVKDANGAVIAGAQIKAVGETLATERNAVSNAEGFYRIVSLPAGTYTVTVTQTGFATSTSRVELTLNRVSTFDFQMQVGNVVGDVNVTDELPLLEPNASSIGITVTPKQIIDLPVNGRNYLDLLQLVPGVAINRQADPEGDNATPVLGERGGNTNFFIDGHPNKDTVNGGPAAQFNQETIAEFQVLTTGYKAEFGQASGAIVNVITKSGGNAFHGVGSFFLRNEALDSVNSLKTTLTKPLPLSRYDYSIAGGGPIIKDKFFFFASAERITESRQIDFNFPDTQNAVVNGLLQNQENPFDTPSKTSEIRNFIKLNQNLGQHQLSQEFNYTNARIKNFLPLSQSQSLPSARNNIGSRSLLLAFGDTVLIGNQGNPFILTFRGAYRGEPSNIKPAHTEIIGSTRFNPYSGPGSIIFGDLPVAIFGNPNTASNLNQKYTSFTANVSKLFGDHDIKFGWNFLRTKADGLEFRVLQNQLFATVADFATFGPANAGVFLLAERGGITPTGDEIHLNNNYNGLFVQDDWKLLKNLSLNLGLRWDYDSEFKTKKNFSPRLGVAWSIDPKTVVRANLGIYYDQFRLGLVKDIPAFGGADQRTGQIFAFPRLLYGSPSYVSSIAFLSGLPGGCFANLTSGNQTDAQITAAGTLCPLTPPAAMVPFIGVDRLNRVVAAGRPPIPANTVVTAANVQALTGLTPQQFADQASLAIGQPAGYFTFGNLGVLYNQVIPPALFPIGIDESFKTPHTLGFSVGIQREIIKDTVINADYYHREMRNLLGVRATNLPFRARVVGRVFDPPFTGGPINTFGPWYEGKYDGLVLSFNSRFAKRFVIGSSYSYAKATDNSLGILNGPSDSFVGIVPVVTQGANSNANGSFTTTQGRFVAQAGQFYNGPDLDKGPSDLALDHVFQINGLIDLPWQFQISGIFRAQSGFHFTKGNAIGAPLSEGDPDGDSSINGLDIRAGRNAFTAPPLTNFDLRFSKRFNLTERVKLQLLFEFFNLLNRQNPAAVGRVEGITGEPFGKAIQVLPGREGQFGFRIEF